MKKASIILTDWSVRESLHAIRFLNRQTIDRNNYEIIWVEYYNKRPMEIKEEVRQRNIDKWIIMGQQGEFHKHKMWNEGVLESDSEIIVIPDSDALFSPTFLETIVRIFDEHENENIILNLGQLRIDNKGLYPYPFRDLVWENIIRIIVSAPFEICNWDYERNCIVDKGGYGSCFCARRDSIIKAQGFDEDAQFSGLATSGAFELGWRLVNKGYKDLWDSRDYLIHLWHPGSLRPDEPQQKSNTGEPFIILKTGRSKPFVENSKIKKLRLRKT